MADKPCCLQMLHLLSQPESAAQLTDDFLAAAAHPEQLLPAGHRLQEDKPAVLVSQISEELGEELRQRFSGTQSSRSAAAVSAGVNPHACLGRPCLAPGGCALVHLCCTWTAHAYTQRWCMRTAACQSWRSAQAADCAVGCCRSCCAAS